MKLIGYLIITICVVTGALSTITAYHVDVQNLSDDDFKVSETEYAHLNYGAGLKEAEHADGDGGDHAPEPLFKQGTELTPEVLAVLRESGTERVRIKEFGWNRWDMWWLFAISVVGLIFGGMLVKTAVRKEIAESDARAQAKPKGSPRAAVDRILEIVAGLERDLPNMSSDEERMDAVIDRLDEMQKELAHQVVEGRTMLIGKLGMGGFAEFMDAFSRFERTLNRAWSAAADGVADEAMACLDEAFAMKDAVRSKLP